MKVETNNIKNCRNCNKSNVCKYQEIVLEEVEKLIEELRIKEIPLSINISCREFLHKSSELIR